MSEPSARGVGSATVDRDQEALRRRAEARRHASRGRGRPIVGSGGKSMSEPAKAASSSVAFIVVETPFLHEPSLPHQTVEGRSGIPCKGETRRLMADTTSKGGNSPARPRRESGGKLKLLFGLPLTRDGLSSEIDRLEGEMQTAWILGTTRRRPAETSAEHAARPRKRLEGFPGAEQVTSATSASWPRLAADDQEMAKELSAPALLGREAAGRGSRRSASSRGATTPATRWVTVNAGAGGNGLPGLGRDAAAHVPAVGLNGEDSRWR